MVKRKRALRLSWTFVNSDHRLSWPFDRGLIEPTRRPAVAFSLRVVCPCGRAMSGIVKVIVSFFRKGEEVAIERHRSRVPVDKEAHKGVSELKKKRLTEFLGLKEQAHKYGIGGFSLKLFRLAKSPAGKCETFCNCDGWAVAT